jgi:hypothetical protein
MKVHAQAFWTKTGSLQARRQQLNETRNDALVLSKTTVAATHRQQVPENPDRPSTSRLVVLLSTGLTTIGRRPERFIEIGHILPASALLVPAICPRRWWVS